MKRYLLRFCKKGNTRFLSHLDIARLFKRAMRRAGIEPAFSNGYNPHELINIVQPLSLGYESESEYFEIDTVKAYDAGKLPGQQTFPGCPQEACTLLYLFHRSIFQG